MSGFVLGYYYNGTNEKKTDKIEIHTDELISKNIIPFNLNDNYYIPKEIPIMPKSSSFNYIQQNIHEEITAFKKESLKKTRYKPSLTTEQELIKKLRKKISDRRIAIKPHIKKD